MSDDKNSPPLTTTLEVLFDKVVARISSSPSESNRRATADTKLRLYGLFKYCTVGPCPDNNSGGSSWNPTEIAKRRAWQACSNTLEDKDQARMEYVQLAASLDETCQQYLDEYLQETSDNAKDPSNEKMLKKVPIMQDHNQKETSKLLDCLLWILCCIFPAFQPVIPRGGLDIAWSDLWFALMACFKNCCYSATRRRQVQDNVTESIVNLWKEQASLTNDKKEETNDTATLVKRQQQPNDNVDVVIGYSVRSLLDLYLMHKKFPPQAAREVVVVPPINIPGMVEILEHYGLVVVPVDTLDIGTAPTQVDTKAVEAAISEHTVAILVVHPFGTTSLSPKGFSELRGLAEKHALEIWEDAAESYQGIAESPGSHHADVTFVSFGLIKTATALGGGMAILREGGNNSSAASNAAEAMRQLQMHHYPVQTTWQYLWNKVAQAVMVKTFSSNPILYGTIVQFYLCRGGYTFWDQTVTRNLRSIVSKTGTVDRRRLIRKRPSLPLLQLLHRRLCQSNQTLRTVADRVQQCDEMTKILQEHAPNVGLLLPDIQHATTHWLYPVQVDPKQKLQIQAYLLERGWDIAAGTSQLQSISPTLPEHPPPISAREWMAKVLYLPVSSRSLTRQQRIELANDLHQAVRFATQTDETETRNGRAKSPSNARTFASISVLIVALCVAAGIDAIVRFVFAVALPRLVSLTLFSVCLMVTAACGLRWLCGSLYLNSSTVFAQYNGMLDAMSIHASEESKESTQIKPATEVNRSLNAAGVLASMPALKLPSPGRELKEGFGGCVILTGATGFVGSLLLRDLLLHRQTLNISAGVFVICRPKKSKSAQERISELLKSNMFSFLTDRERQDLVHVLEGDMTKPNAGLSKQDMERLLLLPRQGKTVTHVIHSAAAVSFTQTMADAARSNITSALTMQRLARQLGLCPGESEGTRRLPKPLFVHLSTAFVHGSSCGTDAEPLPQSLFDLDPYDPTKLYESMLGTQFYASKAMSDLRFHNTYAFTKCVCEHLLLQQDKVANSQATTLIIRPSIVGPAVEYPYEGWAGQKPSTIVAAGCLYLSFQWNLWCFGPSHVPSIPVDVLSSFVLKKAFEWEQLYPKPSESSNPVDSSSSEDSYEQVGSIGSVQSISRYSSTSQEMSEHDQCTKICTAAWNTSSASRAMFTWLDYCGATMHFGANMGYFYRSTPYIGMWITCRLLPRFKLNVASYECIHHCVVELPMQATLWLCHKLKQRSLCRKLSRLSNFLDLPLLFFPYMNETYHFESELSAPTSMDGSRYVCSCVIAAHLFLKKLKVGSKTGVSVSETPFSLASHVIGGKEHRGSFGLWWALTQPKGNLIIRLVGWMFAKILKVTCSALSVDVTSFEAVSAEVQKTTKDSGTDQGGSEAEQTVHLVLAPTHRSFFDFVILSYMAFAIPELHIDIPRIAAAEDFERLPIIGWLARTLGAFYLRRGRGRADPDLTKTLETMKQRGPMVFEVFIEGSRSRDRRFLESRTGLLRSLAASGGRHVVVPISISYEKVPEQDVLAREVTGLGCKSRLSARGLLLWLMDVVQGKIFLGRIHVAAAEPSVLDCKTSSDYLDFVKSIQRRQQQLIYCSEYHVRATAKLLDMEPETVRSAMNRIGCSFWPGVGRETWNIPALPDDPSELSTLMLHFGHKLTDLCPGKQGKCWCAWANPAFPVRCTERNSASFPQDPARVELSKSLVALFGDAGHVIETAHGKLISNGFSHPNLDHLKSTAIKVAPNGKIPGIFLAAAASMYHSKLEIAHSSSETGCAGPTDIAPNVLTEGDERLGFWGFHDSGFALQVDKKGSHFVAMRGNRYSLSGKALSKLMPFVEKETRVKIDPFNEAFDGPPKVFSQMSMESVLGKEGLSLLQSTVDKMSLSVADRIRHGTGHSQEDIHAIRSSSSCSFRIPDAVLWPTCKKELEGLIALAHMRQWCIIPFGGGTNVTQATRCPPKAVEPRPILSVDMTKMNRLLWLNEEDGLACFEAGINGRDLVAALEERGYTMGHEPDSIEFSTLGGWIATKASGMKRNKYGNIEDIVRDVCVTGASGRIWQKGDDDNQCQSTKPVFGRESCGLDFKTLLLGSEGCLGIVASAVVKVWKLPEVKEYESILFARFEHGLSFVRETAKLDSLIPASVRLLDNAHFRLGQSLQADSTSFRERMTKAMKLLFTAKAMATLEPENVACATICYEGNKNEVLLQKTEIKRLARDHGGIPLGPQVGRAGYDMTFMIAYLRDFAMTYHFLGESFETFAPWSKVTSIISETKAKIKQEHEARCLPGNPFVGCRVTQLYHDGACLYFYFCMNTENVRDASLVFSEIEHIARAEILKQGGSLSHHHGIGKVRAGFLDDSKTPDFKKIVSAVKHSIDPDNIFAARNGLFGSS